MRTKVDKMKIMRQDSEENALLDATSVFKAGSWKNNFPWEKNKIKPVYVFFLLKPIRTFAMQTSYLAISVNILAYIPNFVVSTFYNLQLRCKSTIIKFTSYARCILSFF